MKIETVYINNIKAHFGNRSRSFINKVCQKKELTNSIRKELKQKNVDKKDAHKALQERVYNPCNQVKVAVEKKELTEESTILSDSARETIENILQDCYPQNYKFAKNSIFYDIKANPKCHFKAFMKIVEFF